MIGVGWKRPSRHAFDLPGDWRPQVGEKDRENMEVEVEMLRAKLGRVLDMLGTFCVHRCDGRHIGGWCCRCRAKVDERVRPCEACECR